MGSNDGPNDGPVEMNLMVCAPTGGWQKSWRVEFSFVLDGVDLAQGTSDGWTRYEQILIFAFYK